MSKWEECSRVEGATGQARKNTAKHASVCGVRVLMMDGGVRVFRVVCGVRVCVQVG